MARPGIRSTAQRLSGLLLRQPVPAVARKRGTTVVRNIAYSLARSGIRSAVHRLSRLLLRQPVPAVAGKRRTIQRPA